MNLRLGSPVCWQLWTLCCSLWTSWSFFHRCSSIWSRRCPTVLQDTRQPFHVCNTNVWGSIKTERGSDWFVLRLWCACASRFSCMYRYPSMVKLLGALKSSSADRILLINLSTSARVLSKLFRALHKCNKIVKKKSYTDYFYLWKISHWLSNS